jgi:hypothetical protein
MPRGDRRYVLAAFGWLALSGAKPPPKQPDSRPSNKPTAQAVLPSPTPTPTAAQGTPEPPVAAYRGYDPDPCYHAQKHDAADLCAQWRAAIAAEKAAHEARRATSWSIVATLLSGVAIIGLIVTIAQGRSGLRKASEANNLARDSSKRELRAYLAATDFAIENFSPGETPRSTWILRNLGNTPAFCVETTASCFITDSKEKVFFKHRFVLKHDMHPGEIREVPYYWPFKIDYVLADAFQSNKASFVYAGIIRYRDAFGVRRYTTFKRKVAIQALKGGGGSGPLIPCIRGNRSN